MVRPGLARLDTYPGATKSSKDRSNTTSTAVPLTETQSENFLRFEVISVVNANKTHGRKRHMLPTKGNFAWHHLLDFQDSFVKAFVAFKLRAPSFSFRICERFRNSEVASTLRTSMVSFRGGEDERERDFGITSSKHIPGVKARGYGVSGHCHIFLP